METKEHLVVKVKEWVSIEGDIKGKRAEIRELNNRKKGLTDELLNVMKQHQIDCFDIKGGSIIYKKSKTKKPINGKSLMLALGKFFDNDSRKAEEITKYIIENREETIKETIKHQVFK